jgi:transcriptional regulator with XRE-family HTH domain
VPDALAEFVDVLTEARKRQDVSVASVADALGLTEMAVAHWEKRRDDPSAGNFVLWAMALGFTVAVVDEASGAVLATRPAPRSDEAPEEYRLRCVALVLRDARKEAELLQAEVGRRLGVSEWSVQQWENGRRLPRLVRLLEWCAVLGCRLELRGG